MTRTTRSLALSLSLSAGPALAQEATWIQLEAQPSVEAAITRAQVYDRSQDDIAGFSTGGRWNAVVVGPFSSRAEADAALRALRQSGVAPGDAFLTDGVRFDTQIYPDADARAADDGATGATPVSELDAAPPEGDSPARVTIDTPAELPDETVQEARVSEQALSGEDKRALQTALRWAGVYDAGIDGAFGRGTRAAMEAWQLQQGMEPTGVLTTRQRTALIEAYNAVLDGMNLQRVRDSAAGIEMLIPTGAVEFVEYEPPFARFGPRGDDLEAQILLISQEGDQNRLFGLYEILQTLAIVPTEGERSRRDDGFTITGSNDRYETFVTAALEDGQIKGFALVWPANDSARFARIREEMQASFTPVEGVLDPALARPGEDQAVDLVAGLQVRQPQATNAGFYIDGTGSVLTALAALGSCEEITLDGDTVATIRARDEALGLAVLTPDAELAPLSHATFQTQVPRLQSEIAVAGYPYGGVLPAPTLTFGRLADIRGLEGEETLKRLSLPARPGDAGGPVYDNSGSVLGMLLPRAADAAQVLPQDVSFAVDTESILAFLAATGIETATTDTLAFMPPEEITLLAADSTVLVSCW
ncbi:peptidoglycan-binding protein [Salipiger sp. IMCC34102]|uniref:trypsin-like peptidase domain-containing protein n=1 Tax=Salipiger sp. IMCC34102 TaxID=2510647 RepID=UPI00101C075D|nr:trypsin-like peptidase domain-containing protein [Salipiger sp. IMCC34102]RYH02388.1 peptidoglycan-binding protein [Salipiger sp. IMCC34102]